MKTVYKYPLLLEDRQLLSLPFGAKPLTVQLQNDALCLWALVDTDTDAESVPYYFAVCGTGHPVPAGDWDYLTTVQQGPFVWHIFWCCE